MEEIKESNKCPTCGGWGSLPSLGISYQRCPDCDGSGIKRAAQPAEIDSTQRK